MGTKAMSKAKEVNIDQVLGKKIMHFTGAKYFKNSAGCYPEDAEPIGDEPGPGKCWGTTSKGGTYPFLTYDTVFRARHAGGEPWKPTEDISQAMEVAHEICSNGHSFELSYMDGGWKARFGRHEGAGDTDSMAICNAAMKLLERGKV